MFFIGLIIATAGALFLWRRVRYHLLSKQFWMLFGALFLSLAWAQSAAVSMAGPFPWDKQEAGWLLSFGFNIPIVVFTLVYILQPKPKTETQHVKDFLQKRLTRAVLDSDAGLQQEIEHLTTLLDGLP